MIERPRRLVVIGASAFGPPLVSALLSGLKQVRHTAFILIQHSFSTSDLQRAYAATQPFPLCTPVEVEPIVCGKLYIADRGRHLVIETGVDSYQVRYADLTGMFPFCPAIDVTMASAARAARSMVVGVLVSGFAFGRDGSLGGIAIREKGGLVYGVKEGAMREGLINEAISSGAVNALLPLDEIAVKIQQLDAMHPRLRFRPPTDDAEAALRSHVRLTLPFVIVIVGITGGKYRDQGKVLDISAGGLRYVQAAVAPVPVVGTRVVVALSPPRGDTARPWLKEMGTIVRAEQGGIFPSTIAIKFNSEISLGSLIQP